MFCEGLEELPSEVVLYWFTLCFYGYRQSAGRAALRTLLTHEEPAEQDEAEAGVRKRRRSHADEPTLFSMAGSDLFTDSHEKRTADVALEPSGLEMASVAPRDDSGTRQQRKSASRRTLKGGSTCRPPTISRVAILSALLPYDADLYSPTTSEFDPAITEDDLDDLTGKEPAPPGVRKIALPISAASKPSRKA
jgi:hypothetical protein